MPLSLSSACRYPTYSSFLFIYKRNNNNLVRSCQFYPAILAHAIIVGLIMQAPQKRKERMTNPVRTMELSDARRSSMSSKIFSQLSLSFYGENTIRKDKQVIMDGCYYDFRETELKSELTLTKKANVIKSAPKRKKETQKTAFYRLEEKEKEEIQFRTTQDTKMGPKDQTKQVMSQVAQKIKGDIANKPKLSSLEKFRKILLADIVQSRVKTPKNLVLKRQSANTKKP